MKDMRLVSIIIANYDYGRFIGEAIESALHQTHTNVEVIVVDDGSSDGSRAVIESFCPHIRAIFKTHGGQGSGYNVGFSATRGDVVLFVDSDDVVLPGAVSNALRLMDSPFVSKVQWPLWQTDEFGQLTGGIIPEHIPHEDMRQVLIETGPATCGVLLGNCYARSFLEQVLPMPESPFRAGADAYLFTLAPVFGEIRTIEEPQGHYRFHGSNDSLKPMVAKMEDNLLRYEARCAALSSAVRRQLGIEADVTKWRRHGWWVRLNEAVRTIERVIAPGLTFILVDEEQWGSGRELLGRRCLPFLECDGQYWGQPADDSMAIRELHRMRGQGADFIAFAWPAFWWLDHYRGLREVLDRDFHCVVRNEQVLIYDLRSSGYKL